MKRVTLEEMQAARAAVPLTPVMGTYFDIPTKDMFDERDRMVSRERVLCGCPLTIITCHRYPTLLDEIEGWPRQAAHDHLHSYVTREFPESYRARFTGAYDTGIIHHTFDKDDPGTQDGLLIREHFPPVRDVLVL